MSSVPAAYEPLPTHVRYGVSAFTLGLAAIAYLDRVCISTAAPAIKTDLHLSDGQMGYVFSVFTLAYALVELPSGWLIDRFGPRLMLTRIVLWWSVMTAATGLAGGFLSLFTIRLLFGAGEAGCFPGIARVYSRWLPDGARGRGFGLAVMVGALGGAITQPLVVALLGLTSWRHTFPIFGCVGLVWATAWFWWFRDDPHAHAGVNAAELRIIGCDPPVLRRAVPWGRVSRSTNVWALCAMYFGVIYGWYFYLTWLPTYLLEARGFNLKAVGWLAALPLVGIAIGVFAGGWISDVLSRRWGARAGRRLPGLVGLPLAAGAVVCALSTTSPMAAALLLAAAAGLAALPVSPGWAVCIDIGGPHTGVVTGAMNTFGNFGGALSPAIVGMCLERWHSYNAPLITMAGLYLLSTVSWLAIDPTRGLSGEHGTSSFEPVIHGS